MKWNPVNESHFQFERIGFFVVDKDSRTDASDKDGLVFNLTVSLKDNAKPKDTGASSGGKDMGAGKSRKAEQEKALAEKLVRT
jgi:hypothetical protein